LAYLIVGKRLFQAWRLPPFVLVTFANLWTGGDMSSLFPELDNEYVVAAGAAARDWCDPSSYKEVVGVDFGANSVCYYMARAGKGGSVTLTAFRSWLTSLPSGTLVVCEWAHLAVPRTERSLAQPFAASELLDVYRLCSDRGVTLKLAPHAHSGTRMRLWVSLRRPDLIADAEKSDSADAIALAIFVCECNEVSLADPPSTFSISPGRAYGRQVTKRSNVVLNAERTADYHGRFFPLLMKLARKINRRCGCGLKVAATVASTLACEHQGKLCLFTYRGQVPGRWFWMRNVLRFSPWHHQGGTGRSNLMWHTFRPYMARFGNRRGVSLKSGNKYKKVAAMSDGEKAVRTASLRAFRQMVLNARDVCIQKAEKMGAGRVELTSQQQETLHGR
jgi:hypothetical protein